MTNLDGTVRNPGRTLSNRAPTRLSTGLVAAGVLALAFQAYSAGGEPLAKPQPDHAPAADAAKQPAKDSKAAAKSITKSGTESVANNGTKTNAKDAAKPTSKQAAKAPPKDKKEAAKVDRNPAAKVGSAGTIHAAAGARFALASIETVPPADVATVKDAISAVRKGQLGQAADLQKTISDPTARKLVEWTMLRSDDNE